ncbi:CMRF35-like molecule 8 [Rhinatrema bivittatum]|uniref:CMRF35-like molecule 8 n=1 Tax=Rhinatrema bivittatum TaxID=194408 RepID=UPI00112CD569|nr:CMRF35-like molecule 8 [Rhinatrema bivittatum]
MKIFPVCSLIILLPAGLWGLSGPREARGLVGGSLSLHCQYEKGYETNNKYWCRGETFSSCQTLIKTLIKTNSKMESKLSIRDNVTALTFTVTMEELTQGDSGTYWCGTDEWFRDSNYPVIVTVLPAGSWGLSGPREVWGPVGGSLSLQCHYQKGNDTRNKYWCRGQNWSSCDVLAETESEMKGRISIKVDHTKCSFTVTMKQLTEADSGKYWCGTEGQLWDSGDPVTVIVLPGSSTMTPAVTSMATVPGCIDTGNGTVSEEEGSTLSTPSGTNNTHLEGTSGSMDIFYILIPVILLLLFLFALAIVILIRIHRRKKAMKENRTGGNENVAYSGPPPSDTAESAFYSVVRKPADTGPDGLYANAMPVPVSENPKTRHEETQSQREVTPRRTEDVCYSTLLFPVNPHLENMNNARSPQAKTPGEVTYSELQLD